MAIVWWENFEWASMTEGGTGNLLLRADERSVSSGGGAFVTTGVNGFFGRCLSNNPSGTGTDLSRRVGWQLPAVYSEGILSFAMHFTSAGHGSAATFCALRTGSTNQIVLRLNTNGTITALRNTTELATSTLTLQANLRHRIEMAFVIAGGTSGAVTVKVNGVDFISAPGVNTANSGTNFNRFILSQLSVGVVSYDDIWFDTDKTAFIGDQTIALAAFTSDVSGVSTPSSGSDRFAMIDETPANLTDYIDFASTGEDVYEAENMTVTPTSITGLGILYLAQKTDTGTVEFRSRVLSGSDYANGTTQGLNVANYVYTDFFPVDPATGIAWTESGVNGMRPVLERIS